VTRRADELGQATTLVVVVLASMLGLAALVVDVGSWFRADRAAQSAADAAALAGAQALPEDPAGALALAREFAEENGGLGSGAARVLSDQVANDVVEVEVERETPSFFARVLGVGSATVGGSAKARSAVPSATRYGAPVAVDRRHPLLSGTSCPCFGDPTELDFEKIGPGAFRLLNLDDSYGGTGPEDVGRWIRDGFDGTMPLAWYYADPGFKPSSSHVKSALGDRIGTELLFPVYGGTRAQGAGFEYEVVGWTGFHLTGYEIRGSHEGKLHGWFTRFIAQGIQGSSSSQPDFGVRTISLVE
jgi:hypothetical protein